MYLASHYQYKSGHLAIGSTSIMILDDECGVVFDIEQSYLSAKKRIVLAALSGTIPPIPFTILHVVLQTRRAGFPVSSFGATKPFDDCRVLPLKPGHKESQSSTAGTTTFSASVRVALLYFRRDELESDDGSKELMNPALTMGCGTVPIQKSIHAPVRLYS